MSLTKQPVSLNFSQGLDLKTDSKQVSLGKFLDLENSIFDVGGQLTKRNGYGPLTSIVLGSYNDSTSTLISSPSTLNASYLTTFNGDLTALGDSLFAYSIPNNAWVNKGDILPLSLDTLPLIRSNTNQSQLDTVVASNALVCTVFTDNVNGSPVYKFAIADSNTGQNIVPPTGLPPQGGVVTGSPRVFIIGIYFIAIYTVVTGGTSRLKYMAVSTSNPTGPAILGEITSAYVSSPALSWDGVSYGGTLYVAYDSLTGGQNITIVALNSNLTQTNSAVFAGQACTIMSMTVDSTSQANPIIWAAYYNSGTSTSSVFAVDAYLNVVLTPTDVDGGTFVNITCTAQNQVLTFYEEVTNTYSYGSNEPTNLIESGTVAQDGTLSGADILMRSVGLASKAFLVDGVSYFLTAYDSPYQPSYLLVNQSGKIVSRLAYSNGGGYDTVGLPSVTVTDSVAQIGYLIKDFISATNKTQGLPSASTSPVYSQLGCNLVSFNFATETTISSEIGTNLNITGGFVSGYDGYTITEQNFFVWPDNIVVSTSTSGGNIEDQTNFYAVTYEWADNAGNVFRSAPSIPVEQVTAGGDTSTNTINVPTLRLTYKTANPVKIVVYRWSSLQQTYYAIKSPSEAPTLNDPTVDSIAIIDIKANGSILGNPILYTTGGVLENISPPSTSIMTLFNNRLWLVDAEDTNLLWYSKQVIEATPVEMSDLLTLYVAPTTGSQGSTGPVTALAPMDDKLIVFKKNALGYISGIGPDNTGANSAYSDFTLINSVIGCTNQKSIVLTPNGLMFQSDKGIWLLGRDLSTSYIGAPVEALTKTATVSSALNIPTTNQVRFTLSSGVTLMYDYYYGQWGTFTNIPAVSSTIFEGLHTYINTRNQVFQETPGKYLDGSSPVLMAFTTGWCNIAGLQGFERFYFANLLGTYITPFKLNCQLAYNYNPSTTQNIIITPSQSGIQPWGSDPLWGSSSPWGGGFQGNIFQVRVFPQIQKCESFQVSIQELYDPTQGIAAGAGLTLSGLNLMVGVKKGSRTQAAARSFG